MRSLRNSAASLRFLALGASTLIGSLLVATSTHAQAAYYGSRKAANHVFQSAAADGLMIGNLSSGMVSAAVLGVKGVLYDLAKFFYLGSPFNSHIAIFVTRKGADLGTLEKLRAATGIASAGNRSVSRFTTRLVCLATSLVSKNRSL